VTSLAIGLPEGNICGRVNPVNGPGVKPLVLGTNPRGSWSFGKMIGAVLLVDGRGILDGGVGLIVGRGMGRSASAGLRYSPKRGIEPEFPGVFPGVFDCGREGGWIVMSGTELSVERLPRCSTTCVLDEDALMENPLSDESDNPLGW